MIEIIHFDIDVLKNTTNKGGKNYYVFFIDDFFRFTKIFLIKQKMKLVACFWNLGQKLKIS